MADRETPCTMSKNDDLRTPAWVTDPLGYFDLDPCAGPGTEIAEVNWSILRGENGLERDWFGRVWCNPPFSQKLRWAHKMSDHGDGVLLLPERGSAPWFGPVAMMAGCYHVMGRKINFHGGPSSNNVGTILFPFGTGARKAVINSGLPGHFVTVMNFTPRP